MTHWTARMPPHSRMVLRYQSGKWPEVQASVHLDQPNKMTITIGNRQFLDNVDVVSANFFRIVQLPLISGDRAAALAQPESVVLSEKAAQKYFGTVRAVGRTLKIDGGCEYGNGKQGCNPRLANALVTAVMRDLRECTPCRRFHAEEVDENTLRRDDVLIN